MKSTTLLFVLAAICTTTATAAEPRCPLIPMGAITGKPDEQTVKETLEAYKAVGVDQFLIYARSGLEYEYMGEEWLQMCQWFCQHAKRLDMSIWLYDEYNWPSGSCKGRVPAKNPDFESRQYAVYKNADGTDNMARIKVEHPVAEARIVLRHHPVPSEVTLDGKPLRADQLCDTLRPGLNELYRRPVSPA